MSAEWSTMQTLNNICTVAIGTGRSLCRMLLVPESCVISLTFFYSTSSLGH